MSADRESRAEQLWQLLEAFPDGLDNDQITALSGLGWTPHQLAQAKADIREHLQIGKQAPLITVWSVETGGYVTKIASAWLGEGQARAYHTLRTKTMISHARTLERSAKAASFLDDADSEFFRHLEKQVKRLREDLEDRLADLDD